MSCIWFRNTSAQNFYNVGFPEYFASFRKSISNSKNLISIILRLFGRSFRILTPDILGDTNLAVWCSLTGASLPGGARYVVF